MPPTNQLPLSRAGGYNEGLEFPSLGQLNQIFLEKISIAARSASSQTVPGALQEALRAGLSGPGIEPGQPRQSTADYQGGD